jgi:hypothetical protein
VIKNHVIDAAGLCRRIHWYLRQVLNVFKIEVIFATHRGSAPSLMPVHHAASLREAMRSLSQSSISVSTQPCRLAPNGTRLGNFPSTLEPPDMDFAVGNALYRA